MTTPGEQVHLYAPAAAAGVPDIALVDLASHKSEAQSSACTRTVEAMTKSLVEGDESKMNRVGGWWTEKEKESH